MFLRLNSHILQSNKIPFLKYSEKSPLLTITRCRSQTAAVSEDDLAPSPKADDRFTSGAMEGKLDFLDTKTAYKAKTTKDLLRAYFVFGMCSIESLVRNQIKLLGWTRRLIGQGMFKKIMRATVYGQFVAGETDEEVLDRVYRNRKHHVHSMLAYTAAEEHGAAKGSANITDEEVFHEFNYKEFMRGVDLAAKSSENQEVVKITGKYTFLSSCDNLKAINNVLAANTSLVEHVMESHDKMAAFTDLVLSLAPKVKETAAKYGLLAPKLEPNSIHWPGLITSLPFNLTVADSPKAVEMMQSAGITPCNLTEDQRNKLQSMLKRLIGISQNAANKNVCAVLDAEQTYLQLAIDVVTIDLMRMFNTSRAVVHNTYQCYLKRTYGIVTRDLDLAQRENFCLGLKVVRGGYMDEERALAAKLGYEDPVNPTYDATTEMYHKVVTELLQLVRKSPPGRLQLTVATHNENTVQFVVDKMKELGMTSDPMVSFAQLLGMRDHIAYILGASGVHGSKLLHYGPVEGCVAYLGRRISENKSGMPTADLERHLLTKELSRRRKAGELHNKTTAG